MMLRLAQIGFLIGCVILIGLVIYHYPLIALVAGCLAILYGGSLIKSGLWP